ncbi:hypothetical protein KJ708_01135 [bacterium]|nr:hypothetical protein [bacterium]
MTSENRELDFDIVDLVILFWKRKILIISLVFMFTAAAIIVSFLLPEIHRSSALIMPLQETTGMSSIGGGLGQIASMTGLGMGMSSPNAKIMAILKSRTLAENVINQLDLTKVFFEEQWDGVEKKWKVPFGGKAINMEKAVLKFKKFHVSFEEQEELSTIKINADFIDSKLAAKVANVVVAELQKMLNENAFSVSKKNRVFIEEQLKANKIDFFESAKEVSEFYKENQITVNEATIDVNIEELDVYSSNETADPEFLEEKIKTLDKKKEEINAVIQQTEIKEVPLQVYLSYLELRRIMVGKVNELLTTQFEMAKIEEAKEGLSFKVIDPGVEALQRYKPERKKIVIVVFLIGCFISAFLTIGFEFLAKFRKELKARDLE